MFQLNITVYVNRVHDGGIGALVKFAYQFIVQKDVIRIRIVNDLQMKGTTWHKIRVNFGPFFAIPFTIGPRIFYNYILAADCCEANIEMERYRWMRPNYITLLQIDVK